MKRILIFLLCLFGGMAAFSQAEKAKYYIEGEYSITQDQNGRFVYQLTNITSRGITFTPVETIYGKVEPDESISFTFDKANTDCPEGFAAGLKFWKWQYNGKTNSWQRDSEVKDAQQNFETDKVMVVMLVLDCSTSLGETNFEKLKSSATKFINILYNASPDGSIRLGIMGFNTMGNADKMVRDIEPLTAKSRDEMTRFIQGLTLYNNTALYYAMRKSSDMIASYVDHLSAKDAEKFDYACVVSFTDGYDNHSMDPALGVPEKGLENPYFQYVRDNVVNRKIANSNLKSYVIAIKGNDVAEDNTLYKAVFQGISSEEPFLLDDFNQLEAQFEKMAQELIKRWQNLTCYVPSAHQGKVRWTLGNDFSAPATENNPPIIEDKQSPETKPQKSYKAFFGLNVGLDFEVVPKFFGGPSVGLDFAIPKQNYAIGGLVSLDYCLRGPTRLDLGPLFLFGDYMNATAFMLGAGFDMRFPTCTRGLEWEGYEYDKDIFGAGAMLRLGFTLRNHLYFFADFAFGGRNAWYNPTAETLIVNPDASSALHPKKAYANFSLNVGYRFGK